MESTLGALLILPSPETGKYIFKEKTAWNHDFLSDISDPKSHH